MQAVDVRLENHMWLRKHMRLILILAVCAVVLLLGVESCLVISRIRENDRRINEMVLQDRLDLFRRALRKYAESRNELPQSLAELRSSGLAHSLEDPKLLKSKKGIINIHSSSTAISSRGTPYNTW